LAAGYVLMLLIARRRQFQPASYPLTFVSL